MKLKIQSILITVFIFLSCEYITAQTCDVQGIVRYFYNDYIGYKADIGAEVMFIKYNSKYKVPQIKNWMNYQTLLDNRREYLKYRKYYNVEESEKNSGFKEEYVDSILSLSRTLFIEKEKIINNGLVKYSAVVDGTGKYSLKVPIGTYYVLFKSANRKLDTYLEEDNKYYMIRVNLNSTTKILSFDFEL